MEIYDKPAVPDFMNIKPQNPEEVKLPSILDNPSSIRHSTVPLPVKSPEKKFPYKFDDYTFDNFVHGNCNEIAFQSAHAIALSCEEYTDSPDTNYSKKSRKPVIIIHCLFTALQVWARPIFFLPFPIM